jgi:predicted DNA-binding transcriptional regulator AlpA
MMKRARAAAPNSLLAGMLTVDEAAAYLGLSTASLYGYRQSGNGPKSYKYMGRLLYKRADLDEWKAGRE